MRLTGEPRRDPNQSSAQPVIDYNRLTPGEAKETQPFNTCVFSLSSLVESQITSLQLSNPLPHSETFSCFCRLLFLFLKSTFSTNTFRKTILVSNRLDADQARRFVGSDLTGGPYLFAMVMSRRHV